MAKAFFSICSQHQVGVSDCPRCQCGTWHEVDSYNARFFVENKQFFNECRACGALISKYQPAEFCPCCESELHSD